MEGMISRAQTETKLNYVSTAIGGVYRIVSKKESWQESEFEFVEKFNLGRSIKSVQDAHEPTYALLFINSIIKYFPNMPKSSIDNPETTILSLVSVMEIG